MTADPLHARLHAHARAVALWLWLALMTYSASACAQSFGDGLRSYDYESLLWGVVVSLVGGLGRTALTLAAEDVVILQVVREMWRDMVIAALAGAVTYVIIAAVNSTPWASLPVPVSVLLLGAAGWSRSAFFVWAEGAGRRLADRSVDWASDKLSATSRRVREFDPDALDFDDLNSRQPPRGGGRFTRRKDALDSKEDTSNG